MEPRILLLFIHGIGAAEKNFATTFQGYLWEAMVDRGWRRRDVYAEDAHWSPATESVQEAYTAHIKSRVAWSGKLHRFVISAFADAMGYLRSYGSSDPASTYCKIQACLTAALSRLAERVGRGAVADIPLVVVTHSHGGLIAYDYFAQAQRVGPPLLDIETGEFLDDGKTPLHRGETLGGFCTMGANMALSWLGEPPGRKLKFPKAMTADPWLNLFDEHDLLGYPHDFFSEVEGLLEDREVSAGGFINDITDHVGYWKSENAAVEVAKYLDAFLR